MCQCKDPKCEKIRQLLLRLEPELVLNEQQLKEQEEKHESLIKTITEQERSGRAPKDPLQELLKIVSETEESIQRLRCTLRHRKKQAMEMIEPAVRLMFGLRSEDGGIAREEELKLQVRRSDIGLVIATALSPANRQKLLKPDRCILGWFRRTSRMKELRSSGAKWAWFPIAEIVPLVGRTRLRVSRLNLLTGGEHLRIKDTVTTPSINTPKNRYYTPFGTDLKCSDGKYEQPEKHLIELMRVITEAGESDTMRLGIRCGCTQSLDETDADGNRLIPEKHSPNEPQDRVFFRRLAYELLRLRVTLSPDDLLVWKSEMARGSCRMTPDQASNSIKVQKSEWDRSLDRVNDWVVITEMGRSIDESLIASDPEEQLVHQSLGERVAHTPDSLENIDDDTNAVKLRKRIAVRLSITPKTAESRLKAVASKLLTRFDLTIPIDVQPQRGRE